MNNQENRAKNTFLSQHLDSTGNMFLWSQTIRKLQWLLARPHRWGSHASQNRSPTPKCELVLAEIKNRSHSTELPAGKQTMNRTDNKLTNIEWYNQYAMNMIHQMDANIQKIQETKKANPKWPQKCGKTVYCQKEIQYLGYAISNFTWVRVWVGQKGWLLGFRPTDWYPSLAVKKKFWAKWTHAHTEMDFWDGFPKS